MLLYFREKLRSSIEKNHIRDPDSFVARVRVYLHTPLEETVVEGEFVADPLWSGIPVYR